MYKVFKYELPIDDVVQIEMPIKAIILDVDFQGKGLYLWAVVDPDAITEKRTFRIAGTGHPLEVGAYTLDYFYYIKTVMIDGLVFHVFEIKTHSTVVMGGRRNKYKPLATGG